MAWTRPLKLVAFGASAMLLAGCANSTQQAQQTGATPSVGALRPAADSLPADSPLAACIDPTPPAPKPVDTALARDFAGGRIRMALSLDDGTFRAVPSPHNARPRVSASLAFCNLLAGATANNFSVIDAATEHGMSFGLGVVTVADAVLKTGPRSYLVGGQQQASSLQPYHARLAWIAVIKPDVVASCPATPATASTRPTAPPKALPAYQVLAIDADTGTDGIIYSAKTNALCGFPGYQPAAVAPAVEFVSVPWTLVTRGPGPQSATISYQPRPCDQRNLGTFAGTGKPAVLADRTHPGLVSVNLERILTTCGHAVPTPILLRSSTLATDLPEHLVHAPVGAQDTPG